MNLLPKEEEKDRKQTAFPGNSLPKVGEILKVGNGNSPLNERKKRVENRLPFREFATEGGGDYGRKRTAFPGNSLRVPYRRRRRRGYETDCLSGEFAKQGGGDKGWKHGYGSVPMTDGSASGRTKTYGSGTLLTRVIIIVTLWYLLT